MTCCKLLIYKIYLIKGKHGLDCIYDCKCQNQAYCNKKDGSCMCPAGFSVSFFFFFSGLFDKPRNNGTNGKIKWYWNLPSAYLVYFILI